MKKLLVGLIMSTVLFSATSYARNDIDNYDINQVLSSDTAKNKLGNDVQFFFAGQKHGKVVSHIGEIKT